MIGMFALSVAARFDNSLCAQTQIAGGWTLFEPHQTCVGSFSMESGIDEKSNERDIGLLRRIAARDRAAFAEFRILQCC